MDNLAISAAESTANQIQLLLGIANAFPGWLQRREHAAMLLRMFRRIAKEATE